MTVMILIGALIFVAGAVSSRKVKGKYCAAVMLIGLGLVVVTLYSGSYNLTVNFDPSGGGGWVHFSSGAGDAHTGRIIPYPAGTSVTLTAYTEAGWVFNSWSGDISSTNASIPIVMNSDISVYAHFTQLPPPTNYTLTTSVSPAGGGTVSGGGTYGSGTTVTVTAIPASGYQFNNWSGDLSGSINPTTITMNNNKNIIANFRFIPTYGITVRGFNRKAGEFVGVQFKLEDNAYNTPDEALGLSGSHMLTILSPSNQGDTFVGWDSDGNYNTVESTSLALSITSADDGKTFTALYGSSSILIPPASELEPTITIQPAPQPQPQPENQPWGVASYLVVLAVIGVIVAVAGAVVLSRRR